MSPRSTPDPVQVARRPHGEDAPSTLIVVPCYNEEERFRPEEFLRYSENNPHVRFVLVNDGSTDGTLALLEALASKALNRFDILDLKRNEGKAEAVRRGMLRAFAVEPVFAGYWDADLATPLSELQRFIRVLNERPLIQAVFGSRINLLGRQVQRTGIRHASARVFSTLASRTLGLVVYDGMCGAKLFRASPEVRALFQEPFITNWPFDVEILARWTSQRREAGGTGIHETVHELPLRSWHEVPGSKVRPTDAVKALLELRRIRCRYLRAR